VKHHRWFDWPEAIAIAFSGDDDFASSTENDALLPD
jgi:hypothetical protein